MIVHGEGDLTSKIWLIGEAPGTKEDESGRPFMGGAGVVLNGMLRTVGIDREDIYVDNVIQTKPPGNNFSLYYSDKKLSKPTSSLLEAHERIKDLVFNHKPNVVVALGNESLVALTGKRGIMNWRGSVLECRGVKVIPTLHPAAVMRQPELHPIGVMDLTRIKEEALSPSPLHPYTDTFITSPSFEDLIFRWFPFLHSRSLLSFDIETLPAINQIECIGFGWSDHEAICIPIFYGGKSWYTLEEELVIIGELKRLFANPRVNFIAQNAQYDMTFILDLWGVEVHNLWLDTMSSFHCVYPELKKGLGFISSIFTSRPYYKGESGGSGEKRWIYNCLDCVVTFESGMKIVEEMREFGTHEFYQKYSHPLIKPIISMQRFGVLIDQEMRDKIKVNLEQDLFDLQTKLDKAVGHPLNTASPIQMQEFLYTEMHLPVMRKKKRITCDENALEKLEASYPNPVFRLIKDIRKIEKLLSTYINAQLDPDGRIRCSYIIPGTVTGRLASKKSVHGTGGNLQNILRGPLIRSYFIADPGFLFVNGDLSQAEARVVAYVSGETRLQALFENPEIDVYVRLAGMFLNKREGEVSESERQMMKTVVHASNYRVGSHKLAQILGCGEAEARSFLNKFYAMFPCIKLWHREIEEKIQNTRMLTTPLGRKRMFFGRWGDSLIREAIAHIPQSTVGDVLNYGIIKAYPNLPPQWNMCLQNHDAELFQVPEFTPSLHVYKFIKHYFEYPILIHDKQVVIPIDIKVGKRWGDMHPLDTNTPFMV